MLAKFKEKIMPKYIHQADFYTAMSGLPGSSVRSSFRQVGDLAQAGYLLKGSEGACTFTTLDFHRAVSQGCEREWMAVAGQAKEGSSLLQSTVGTKGTSFGARQIANYASQEKATQDPLFTRSMSDAQKQSLAGQSIERFRHPVSKVGSFSPGGISDTVARILSNDPTSSIRLNFEVDGSPNKGKEATPGHTIGICQARDGTLYVMDPNAGVISTNRSELPQVLDKMRSTLYKDYTLGETIIETQEKFWLDPSRPLSGVDVAQYQQDEQRLLTGFSIADYQAALKDSPAARATRDEDGGFVNVDDDKEVPDKTRAPDKGKAEAVFADQKWDGLGRVEVDETLVATASPAVAKDEAHAVADLETRTAMPAALADEHQAPLMSAMPDTRAVTEAEQQAAGAAEEPVVPAEHSDDDWERLNDEEHSGAKVTPSS